MKIVKKIIILLCFISPYSFGSEPANNILNIVKSSSGNYIEKWEGVNSQGQKFSITPPFFTCKLVSYGVLNIDKKIVCKKKGYGLRVSRATGKKYDNRNRSAEESVKYIGNHQVEYTYQYTKKLTKEAIEKTSQRSVIYVFSLPTETATEILTLPKLDEELDSMLELSRFSSRQEQNKHRWILIAVTLASSVFLWFLFIEIKKIPSNIRVMKDKVINKKKAIKKSIYEQKVKTIAEEEAIRQSVRRNVNESTNEEAKLNLEHEILEAVKRGDSEIAKALSKILNKNDNV